MSECDTGAIAVGWSSWVVARWPVVKYIWDSYIKQCWYIVVCWSIRYARNQFITHHELDDGDDADHDGDGDDVDSDSDRAEICWKSILVRSRTLLQSHCPGVELQHGACQNFVSLETYTWDHTFSGPRSDARSDTPRYPERYLKSMKLGSTPHGHLKLYNLCYRWKNMGSMNKGTLKFLMG